VNALGKQSKMMCTGVNTFTSHHVAAKSMQTTANIFEEDIISGAVA